jgi:hypothetical protein
MLRTVFRDIAFAVRVVMPDSSEVTEQLARGDGPLLFGKSPAIVLHLHIEIHLSALGKLQDRGSGDGLGNRTEPEQSCRCRRNKIFEVGHSEASGPDQRSVLDDGQGNSRHAVCRHETRCGLFDLRALIGGKALALGSRGRKTKEEDQ